MNTLIILEMLKAIGPVFISLAVLIVTCWFYRWQIRLAKQKLRQDLYERRFAIYVAFRELLISLIENSDGEIKNKFQKASIARIEAQFVLADPTVQATLDALCKRIEEDVIRNILYIDDMKPYLESMTIQIKQEFANRIGNLGKAKLDIVGCYYEELPKQFSKFLKLTDFSN